MAHAVEKELIKVTAYKARTKFADRQDYLGSILNAVMKLDDAAFDDLSDEAATWANAAVEAKNGKSDIPDFDEITEEASDETGDEADDEAEDSGDDSEDSDDSSDSDDDGAAVDDDDADDEDAEIPEDDSEDEDEPEEKPVKKKAKPPAKPVKAEKPEKKQGGKRSGAFGRDDDVVLDKWGCMEGSKNQRALAMFEKGATAKEVKEEVGGTYYNILKRLTAEGHSVEKEGAVIKITHKSDKVKAVTKTNTKTPTKKKK